MANPSKMCGDFDTGEWVIESIKPGRVGNAAPHLTLWIVARGINIGLHSRVYFSDEANKDDPVLKGLSQSDRATLIADRDTNDAAAYSFNIHLQGDSETVFFDV
jgi:protocatechuate 3,4-dioxygenase alpha subunit